MGSGDHTHEDQQKINLSTAEALGALKESDKHTLAYIGSVSMACKKHNEECKAAVDKILTDIKDEKEKAERDAKEKASMWQHKLEFNLTTFLAGGVLLVELYKLYKTGG